MLTKNQIKLITSLDQKKFRNQHQLFVVEGKKGIAEFLNSTFELYHLFATEPTFKVNDEKFTLITEPELKKISKLKNLMRNKKSQRKLKLLSFIQISLSSLLILQT